MGIILKSQNYAWSSVSVDAVLMAAIVAKQAAKGWTYELGAKIPLSLDTIGQGGKVDCSGEVRYLLHRCAGIDIPDGSVNQHDWIKKQGFKISSVEAAKLADGAIRIAFLTPADGGGTGHVVLIYEGMTYESHGHKGPDSRKWTGTGWQAHTHVYVLQPPH